MRAGVAVLAVLLLAGCSGGEMTAEERRARCARAHRVMEANKDIDSFEGRMNYLMHSNEAGVLNCPPPTTARTTTSPPEGELRYSTIPSSTARPATTTKAKATWRDLWPWLADAPPLPDPPGPPNTAFGREPQLTDYFPTWENLEWLSDRIEEHPDWRQVPNDASLLSYRVCMSLEYDLPFPADELPGMDEEGWIYLMLISATVHCPHHAAEMFGS